MVEPCNSEGHFKLREIKEFFFFLRSGKWMSEHKALFFCQNKVRKAAGWKHGVILATQFFQSGGGDQEIGRDQTEFHQFAILDKAFLISSLLCVCVWLNYKTSSFSALLQILVFSLSPARFLFLTILGRCSAFEWGGDGRTGLEIKFLGTVG